MARRRILIGGLYHETHSFVADHTPLDDFAVLRESRLLDRRGDGSTFDGFFDIAADEEWDVIPGVDYTALPSGTVEHTVFENFWREFNACIDNALREGELDGIWLSLHGAMVTTECVDAEGEFLRRIRGIAGARALPIFGVLDLHGAFTEAMAKHANGLVAYRENPHSDAREAAARSASLLARALHDGVLPHMESRTAPVLWPPTGTASADPPMRDLLRAAREIEAAHPEIWRLNVFAGFAFSDTPDAGASFSAIVAPGASSSEMLDRLVNLAFDMRELGRPREWDLDEAIARIPTEPRKPVIIVEPADNIGGGAAGDGTAVLEALLRHGIDNAAVVIADAAAVVALAGTPIGARRRLSIGGWSGSVGARPLSVDATLVSRSDGRFALEDAQSHLAASQGVHFDMGPCCVVKVDGVRVLLTSRKTPPFDLGQLRSQGIAPETLTAIGVKAAVAHRRAYDPIAGASYTVTTAGPCASDLRLLPYKRLRSGVYPVSR